MIHITRGGRSRRSSAWTAIVAAAGVIGGCGPVGQGTITVKSPDETTQGILNVGVGGPPRLAAPPVSETVKRR